MLHCGASLERSGVELSFPSDFHRNCRCVVETSPEILDVLEKIVPEVGCSGPLLDYLNCLQSGLLRRA